MSYLKCFLLGWIVQLISIKKNLIEMKGTQVTTSFLVIIKQLPFYVLAVIEALVFAFLLSFSFLF